MLRERPRSFVYAVLVHLALLGVLVFSLDWAPSVTPGAAGKKAPVQAVVVDAAKLESEIQRQQQQKDRKRREAEEKLKKMEQQARAAEQKRKQEEQRVAELKRKEAEAKKKAETERRHKAEARKKAEVERKRKAEAKKKAEAERKRKAEAKKKAEAERKRKAEAKKKAEAERKRKEAAKKKAEAERKAAEQELQARLAAEQAHEAARRRSAMQRVIDEYVLLIQQKVERSWIRPPDAGGDLSCTVEVRLIPGGEVIDAQIVRSSGNPVFDRSVEAAVFKASPLPVPSDVDVMQKFRTIRFEFKPG